MKLHFALASPFARKVRVSAIELGLEDKVELLPTLVKPGEANEEYAGRFNPLRRIPALTLSDGKTIVDSVVICEYLDNVVGENKLFPKASTRRWEVLTDHALANGMTELAVLLRYETALRPEDKQWPLWIDDLWDKINKGLDKFEGQFATDTPDSQSVDIARVSLACLLGYLDFRFDVKNWRKDRPALSEWFAQFSERPSMSNTIPDA